MIGIFYYPTSLYLFVPLTIALIILLVRRYIWQRQLVEKLGGTEGKDALLKNFSIGKAALKAVLIGSSLVCLLIALARPQWGEASQVFSQEGRDILIALDISRSMLAQDSLPSRLEAAKTKIRQLVHRLSADRISLMVFSGIAVIQCPLTRDSQAFLNFLDLADTEAVSEGSTAFDAALKTALQSFESVPGRSQRLMIFFTDGEDFSADLSSLESRIKQLGMRIFTIGVGTPEGAPIPQYDLQGNQQGFLKDDSGAIVITRLNESLLKQLARQTGAYYVRMTKNDEDIDTLVSAVQRFKKEKFDDATFTLKEERYMLFAGISLLLLLTEWLL